MKRICVFCGSSFGRGDAYKKAAVALGKLLAKRKIGLVYGGAKVGLMGAMADAALAAGGEVIGVITKQLTAFEVAHPKLTELRTVETMHERKAEMEKLSDGFIALPGGFGTMDEFCEVVTWAQLGIHQKPCGVLNVDGYYDDFLKFRDHALEEGFIRQAHRDLFYVAAKDSELLDLFAKHKPPEAAQEWLRQHAPKP
jgi:hypothetical protein